MKLADEATHDGNSAPTRLASAALTGAAGIADRGETPGQKPLRPLTSSGYSLWITTPRSRTIDLRQVEEIRTFLGSLLPSATPRDSFAEPAPEPTRSRADHETVSMTYKCGRCGGLRQKRVRKCFIFHHYVNSGKPDHRPPEAEVRSVRESESGIPPRMRDNAGLPLPSMLKGSGPPLCPLRTRTRPMSEYFADCLSAYFAALAIAIMFQTGRESEAVVLFTTWLA